MWNPKSVTSLSFMNMSWTCVKKKNKSFGWPRREAGGEGEPFANERFTRSLKKAACYNVGWINGDIMGISCKYHVDQWKYHGDVTKNLFVMGKWCLTNGFSLTLIHVDWAFRSTPSSKVFKLQKGVPGEHRVYSKVISDHPCMSDAEKSWSTQPTQAPRLQDSSFWGPVSWGHQVENLGIS